MPKNTVQSVEPNITDLVNGWLKSYKLDYKLEQESLNDAIDKALNEYKSKQGGNGGNRPDAKLLAKDAYGTAYPVLIEYKGYRDRLVKKDENGNVALKTADNKDDFKSINSYAVNGAVHYANALLQYTDYEDIISIGVTGYKDDGGKLQHEIGVYYVSGKNFGYGQEVAKYSDLSFLKKENFDAFIEKVKALNLTDEEKTKSKEKREAEIASSLVKLNNDIYKNESGLGESARIYLVAASIIANLGIKGENPVKPLEKSDLKCSAEKGERDGDIMLRKINAFLSAKNVPEDKKNLIVQTFSEGLLTNENINKPINGESQLKRVFSKVIDDLGLYYKIGLTTDFTGRLFNEMYNWLGFTQDKLNDVVLTPSYVATFLARLARVNKDSYVWDFATGSAGLLVAAMNIMIDDAKASIKSPDEFKQKEAYIKANQLLGLEILPSIYMLAILNMILMGDGSSNILNKNSLTDFNGNYGFVRTSEKFPATAFVLNPPYSASGNGMVFVEKALSMMDKGYAAIIIQNSAGSGKAAEYNRRILKHSTLLASIKMPIDLFVGKSSVQTNVYVFRVGEPHQNDELVKFIDFSNDGYTRTNRKKASINLRDTDRAKERYDEVVNLVRFGKSKLNIFTEKEYYENTIDAENGADWNQSAPVDTKPTLADFKKTVADYLAWEVSNLLKNADSNSERNRHCEQARHSEALAEESCTKADVSPTAQHDSCHSEHSEESILQRDVSPVAQHDINFTEKQDATNAKGFVYMVTNRTKTTLYIGVTSDLKKRIWQHKKHVVEGFTDKYNCENLVYFECFSDIKDAIEREKYLKGKKREFKNNLVNAINPKWLDLYDYLFRDVSPTAQHDNCHCEQARHSEALAEESCTKADVSLSLNMTEEAEKKSLGK